MRAWTWGLTPPHVGLSPASPPSGFHRDPTNPLKGSVPAWPLPDPSSMTAASVSSSQPVSSLGELGAPEPQGWASGTYELNHENDICCPVRRISFHLTSKRSLSPFPPQKKEWETIYLRFSAQGTFKISLYQVSKQKKIFLLLE